jgi:hypothetical protein
MARTPERAPDGLVQDGKQSGYDNRDDQHQDDGSLAHCAFLS